MTLRTLRWTTAAMVLAAVLVALPLGGAQADDLKVAVVNSQMLRLESSAGKAIQQAIQTSEESFRKEMTGRRDKLQQLEQEVIRLQSSGQADAFNKKRAELSQKGGEFDRDIQAHRKALDQGVNEAARTLQTAIEEIIAGIAHDKGLALVVDRGVALFTLPSLDLTADVISKLNAKLPTVTVNLPPRK